MQFKSKYTERSFLCILHCLRRQLTSHPPLELLTCGLSILQPDHHAFPSSPGSSPVSSPRKPSHPVMDFFSSNLLGDSSSPASISSHADVHEIIVSDFLISDENLQKMENVLDLWSSGLKVLHLFNYGCLVCSITFLLLIPLFTVFFESKDFVKRIFSFLRRSVHCFKSVLLSL